MRKKFRFLAKNALTKYDEYKLNLEIRCDDKRKGEKKHRCTKFDENIQPNLRMHIFWTDSDEVNVYICTFCTQPKIPDKFNSIILYRNQNRLHDVFAKKRIFCRFLS